MAGLVRQEERAASTGARAAATQAASSSRRPVTSRSTRQRSRPFTGCSALEAGVRLDARHRPPAPVVAAATRRRRQPPARRDVTSDWLDATGTVAAAPDSPRGRAPTMSAATFASGDGDFDARAAALDAGRGPRPPRDLLARRSSPELLDSLLERSRRRSRSPSRRASLTEDLHRRQSEARFRSLVAHSSDLITVLDGDGIVTYQSPSIERVLGYSVEEIEGHAVRSAAARGRPASASRR